MFEFEITWCSASKGGVRLYRTSGESEGEAVENWELDIEYSVVDAEFISIRQTGEWQ